MTCLLNNGSVFFHIPKTGGTWVYNVLESLGLIKSRLGHVHADYFHAYWNQMLLTPNEIFLNKFKTLLGYRQNSAAMPTNTFSFCFVREPLAWYESYWKYMQSLGWPTWGEAGDPRQWHPCCYLNGLGSDDFGIFTSRVLAKRPGFVSELYGWYTHPAISFIGKQEYLSKDLAEALRILNIPNNDLNLRARENVSDSPEQSVSWDPRLAEDILHSEAAAYRRYQYSEELALKRIGQ